VEGRKEGRKVHKLRMEERKGKPEVRKQNWKKERKCKERKNRTKRKEDWNEKEQMVHGSRRKKERKKLHGLSPRAN
jgi:hypothetical protein